MSVWPGHGTKVFKIVPRYVGFNEGYLLLQEVAHCTGITKLHENIVSTFFCLCVYFRPVKEIRS